MIALSQLWPMQGHQKYFVWNFDQIYHMCNLVIASDHNALFSETAYARYSITLNS